MPVIVKIITALSIALLVGTLFSRLFEKHTSVVRLPLFFLTVFLGSWAGGLWVIPFEEAAWTVYWIPSFAGGMVIAAVVASVSTIPFLRASVDEALTDSTERTRTVTTIEGFLWILSILLTVPIVLHHVNVA